jgi:hypothetical protein
LQQLIEKNIEQQVMLSIGENGMKIHILVQHITWNGFYCEKIMIIIIFLNEKVMMSEKQR